MLLLPATQGPLTRTEVARYVAGMTRDLEAMAGAAGLEVLAYCVRLARADAETLVYQMERERADGP